MMTAHHPVGVAAQSAAKRALKTRRSLVNERRSTGGAWDPDFNAAALGFAPSPVCKSAAREDAEPEVSSWMTQTSYLLFG